MANGSKKNGAMMAYVVISLIAVVVLVVLLVKCKGSNGENYCMCRGARRCECTDWQERKRLYESGQLTEFSPQTRSYTDPMAKQTQFQQYPAQSGTCS